MAFAAEEVVRRSLAWFRGSGIMRPADGFWGVAERIAVLSGNEACAQIRRMFPAQTPLGADAAVLEHRRPDCNLQAALLFDLAAGVFGDPELRSVADRILDYLLGRSGLRDEDPASPTRGLWGWANPGYWRVFWADDNAWIVIISLVLANRGRPAWREVGVEAARALRRHAGIYLEACRDGRESAVASPVHGLRMNPHWMGLVAMAFAFASRHDPDPDYAALARLYHDLVVTGPRTRGRESGRSPSGEGWSVSEHAYLSLTATVAAALLGEERIGQVARRSADHLVRVQGPEGEFRSEHDEAPTGEGLADLIYTQNWATLGLQHAARHFRNDPYRAACLRSLGLLARIQEGSGDPRFSGCWRGMYDMKAGAWGGGNRHEGGAGSVYSGWTNAPVALAFLFEVSGADFLADPAPAAETAAGGE